MTLKSFPAAQHNIKRLIGIPLTKKVNYLSKTIFGEIIRRRTKGTFGLRLVEISLTNRCQCRCKHCFATIQNDSELMKEELTTQEVKSLIDEIYDIGGVEIIFSGGEPLLRNDLLELINFAHQKGIVTRLITNGLLLNEKKVSELKQAGLNWASISLDSPKSEIHDEFRNVRGCFENAINGLNLFIKNKIPCSIITVARRELIYSGELEEIVQLGRDIGVNVVRINFPVPIGRFKNQQEQVLTFEEREKVRELLKYDIVTMESPHENTRCTAAVTKLNVFPNGDISPCVFIPLSYGNIRNQKFLDIWENMEKYLNKFAIKGQCPLCDAVLRNRIFDETNGAIIS